MPALPLPPRRSSASPTPQQRPPLRPPAATRAGGNRSVLWKPGRRRPALLAAVRAKGKDEASFTDRILDYIEGGPKLRRWYGAPDLLPKDGGAESEEDESPDIEEPRDAVLVTNGDSEIGQMVILALILKRTRIKALVKDKRSTEEAFGTYVEDGFFSDSIDLKGVQHIVLVSQLVAYRNSGGLQAIMNSKLRKLAERDEEVVLASGIPSTIIRIGSLQSTPGGERDFDFTEGIAAKGRISKEDAATICVEALDAIPRKTLIFEVANGDEKVADWKAWFVEQTEKDEIQ
ncbi:uncharacterized protein LOC133912675 isoform X2 [Phragmites australis]|uniref:uncharacterized protein LOC133912675 isoform X2 n=1 Tax=Phragmites australis TaxID=29695 RepID=UPI002D771C1C|nr:uncharacterized protein LOC133912675 isoform X2 [Phragmites australis]